MTVATRSRSANNLRAKAAEQDKAVANTTSTDDVHASYEFGGPLGVTAMMLFFPPLMYYLWICLVFYDGKLEHPAGFAPSEVSAFLVQMKDLVYAHAYPTTRAWTIYVGLMVYELVLAWFMPGYMQEGLPVPSLKGKKLMYNCNALGCFYVTCITAAGLHFGGIFHLGELIDRFGEIMSVAMILGNVVALVCYVVGITLGSPIRMSGNHVYDFFAGAVLNPRIGPIDIKMFAEVRVPWILLFLISLGGAAKQYDQYGFVSANQGFMVLATGLYINACAKGEECIPQTWDMVYEKFGWLLSFWNLAGVPFMYSYSIIYMATHNPEMYKFPLLGNILLYVTVLASYSVFDVAMAQKSRFKMIQDGTYRPRYAFPQLPGTIIKNPKYIKCANGGKLLVDGFWAYARKPNYTADFIQSFTWAVCAGFGTPIVYWYPFFFLNVLVHRCGRDFERCARKYGKDWEEYCRVVPYKFIPGIY